MLSRGRLVGVLDNGPGAAQRIGELMVGREETACSLMTDAAVETAASRRVTSGLTRGAEIAIRSLVPLMLALLAGGVLLAVLGRNPFSFYGSVWTYGVAEWKLGSRAPSR